jgi:tRNA G18 (ribose-2'-O)-methylase SpoU
MRESDSKRTSTSAPAIVSTLASETLELDRAQPVRAATMFFVQWFDRDRLRYIGADLPQSADLFYENLPGKLALVVGTEQIG